MIVLLSSCTAEKQVQGAMGRTQTCTAEHTQKESCKRFTVTSNLIEINLLLGCQVQDKEAAHQSALFAVAAGGQQ